MIRHPIRLVIITTAAFFGASCAKEPVDRRATDNPNVPISHLMTVDGCNVYRFNDAGSLHYLATCPATVASTYSESCGKGCTTDVDDTIQTVARP